MRCWPQVKLGEAESSGMLEGHNREGPSLAPMTQISTTPLTPYISSRLPRDLRLTIIFNFNFNAMVVYSFYIFDRHSEDMNHFDAHKSMSDLLQRNASTRSYGPDKTVDLYQQAAARRDLSLVPVLLAMGHLCPLPILDLLELDLRD